MAVEMILARGEFVKIEENEYQQCFNAGVEVRCRVVSLQEAVGAIVSSDHAIFVFRNPEAVTRRFLELMNAVIDRVSGEGRRVRIVMEMPKTHEKRSPISDPRDLLFKAFAYMEMTP